MKKNSQKNLGFTLIEVMIYIALFSILMGGVFITVFRLLDGSNKLNNKITIQEEGNFVLRKLDWMFTGLDSANLPVVSGTGCSQSLSIQKINFPGNPILLRFNTNSLELKEGAGAYLPLTTSNVVVSCLKVRLIPVVGTSPFGITATTTINGVDFSITKYFRK